MPWVYFVKNKRAKAFGSAIDASELTASFNVLDQEISHDESPLPSSAIIISDSEGISNYTMPASSTTIISNRKSINNDTTMPVDSELQ